METGGRSGSMGDGGDISSRERGPSTVGGAYAHAWGTFKERPGRLVLVLVVFAILQTPVNVFERATAGSLLIALYQLLVVGPLGFGLSYSFLLAVRGQDPEVGDLFAPFQQGYLQAVAASLLLPLVLTIAALPMVGAIALATLGGGLAWLLVPAAALLALLPFFATVRLSFLPYLLVDERLRAIEALGESWSRTEAVQLQIVGVELLAIPLLLLGLVLLVVGVVPAIILVSLALATLYDDVSPEDLEPEPGVGAPLSEAG